MSEMSGPKLADAAPTQYRSLFISDLHLGMRGCQAEMILDFLRHNEAETIYLVGDVFDGWAMRRRIFWPQTHNDVVQKLLRKARNGSRIIYVPGNHDEVMRSYLGTHFGGVEVVDRSIHETLDGRTFLVIHGDQFDLVVMNHRVLTAVGDRAYEAALWANRHYNRVRRALGFPYWSFSKWAKNQVKRAVAFIGDFEEVLASEARKIGVDGVICGHIHQAAMRKIHAVDYVNTGDWVESCTAIAEDHSGQLILINWANEMAENHAANAQSKANKAKVALKAELVARSDAAANSGHLENQLANS
ncbi:MAG: UDP-2,3-diacylglucosamine diphosphatase [Pseudomonadota bacterium]